MYRMSNSKACIDISISCYWRFLKHKVNNILQGILFQYSLRFFLSVCTRLHVCVRVCLHRQSSVSLRVGYVLDCLGLPFCFYLCCNYLPHTWTWNIATALTLALVRVARAAAATSACHIWI